MSSQKNGCSLPLLNVEGVPKSVDPRPIRSSHKRLNQESAAKVSDLPPRKHVFKIKKMNFDTKPQESIKIVQKGDLLAS